MPVTRAALTKEVFAIAVIIITVITGKKKQTNINNSSSLILKFNPVAVLFFSGPLWVA